MTPIQADLFAEDGFSRNELSEAARVSIRQRLEITLLRLEASATFPWSDPLDAAHEENRFERDVAMLGEEGKALWTRFDQEMNRLHETRR